MAYVNMAHMPKPKTEYVVNLQELNGGINLAELEYRLSNKESPEMRNLFWKDGVLCSRDGQEWVSNVTLGEGYAMYERLFHGCIVAHIGSKLYYLNTRAQSPEFIELFGDVPETRGTFFHYFDSLYYKTTGAYICIGFSNSPRDGLIISASGGRAWASPEGEGQEDDLAVLGEDSAAWHFERGRGEAADIRVVGVATEWYAQSAEEYEGESVVLTAVSVEGYTPVTVINAHPATGSGDLYQPENRIQPKKTVKYNAEAGATVYQLPVTGVGSVVSVSVDGVTLAEGTDYEVDLSAGTVTFYAAPPVTNPPTNNTVVITYSKTDADVYNAIMDCPYAVTYGGTGDLCVVMGGCPAQPNAFFWNGNNIVMDATYFPMAQYQLAGDTDDPIMGFGKQQSFLVVFKERSVGRAKMSTTELDGRTVVEMPYVAINDRIGCDLPWSIQLIDNNLVWCNTDQGVHVLKDSSYAYENNIECFSTKINDGLAGVSLLKDVREDSVVCSVDDSKRYWLCANGHVWVWDYENSDYKKPSWYYFTDVNPVAFASELDDLWHLDAKGRLTIFRRTFSDYGEPIDKSFRFTVQDFGGYDRLKTINSIILVLRPDTDSTVRVKYLTDYETREDLVDLKHLIWKLSPRDLSYRVLSGAGFGAAFRRRPMCRRVQHFTMQLDNSVVGQDLGIVAAQIFYNYQGRFR